MGITKSNLFTEEQNEFARVAKALAHPARVAIIDHLIKQNACINGDLVQELGLAQATISQHLRELKEVGIIMGTIEGTKVSYCINPERWKAIQQLFEATFSRFQDDDGVCC
ncbi:ArsR/SmtB family transcription factor [Marinoscillum furvescens]|uniref:ArsR family transcriptional regulator n=1 Tax=Marinoscillum furvescens DSM 4134 TaxID=1122208 RepID=A0A3D9L0U2_MARFU|nr:metalloregulator ArsR/SmtB family transcription factor [Marinoscillum furvescens]RED97064.1 ArsR family transcriptional regulator [Marinoscillum furvescens DSM 4134]